MPIQRLCIFLLHSNVVLAQSCSVWLSDGKGVKFGSAELYGTLCGHITHNIRWKEGQFQVCRALWQACNGCIQIYLRHNSLSVGRYKACVNWINVNDKTAQAKRLLDPEVLPSAKNPGNNFIQNLHLRQIFHWQPTLALTSGGPLQGLCIL